MRHQSIDKRAQPSSDLKSRRIHPEGMLTCWYALSSLGLLEARYRLRPDSRPTGFGTWRDTDVVARWQNGDVFSEQQCPILFAHGIHERPDTIENENDAFRIREAEAQSLLLVMAFCQRLGDVPSWPEPARVHGRHVRIASKREPQMRQSSRSPLDWGVLVCEGAGDASRCDSYGLWD